MPESTTTRFLELLDELPIRKLARNAQEIAKKSGMSAQNITNIKKGRNGLGSNDAEKFLTAFPEVNRTWFNTGKGEKFNKLTATDGEARAMERLMAKYGLKSLAEQIMELKALLDDGVITKAEFNKGKRKILR